MKKSGDGDDRDQIGLWDREKKPLPVTRDTEEMDRRRARETRGKEEALSLLEATRARVIAAGRDIARRIAAQKGRVTAVEVLATMRTDLEYATAMAQFDPRWSGCLFRGEEWDVVGTENEGSHRRPVRIWCLRD